MLKRLRWLYPGMGVKRWLALNLAGTVLVTLGVIFLYRQSFDRLFHYMPLPNWLAAVLLIVIGFGMMVTGLRQALTTVLKEVRRDDEGSVVDLIYKRRYLQRGPKIVVIGGGTGLSTLLKGLKEYTSNLTAIVTVTDDGGSSGRLRNEYGVLPPGDIRNCLVALADRESLMEKVLQYRFTAGAMAGHSLGNLFIVALSDLTGNFYSGVKALSEVLAIRGQVLPSTLQNVAVGAEFADGSMVQGESSVAATGKKIKQLFLEPADCQPLPEALRAIEEADAILLGPGSLYTSVIPNLLVGGIPEAIKKSKALKVYICNVMTQPGETKNYSASEHLQAVHQHGGKLVDYILVNTGDIPKPLQKKYRQQDARPVQVDVAKIKALGVKPVKANLVLESDLVRHHPQRLAQAILRLIFAVKTPDERQEFVEAYIKR